MTREPSDHPTEAADAGVLLDKARWRGKQIRLRRRLATGIGSAALVAAIAVPLSLQGGGSAQRLVQVTGPSTTGQTPGSNPSDQSTSPYSPTTPQPNATTATSPVSPTVSPPTSGPTPPSPTSVQSPPTTVTVTDASKGQTVNLAVGSTLIVQLTGDTWTIGPSSQPSVLGMQGAPTQHHPTGVCSPPGTPCGSTTATFRAERPGTAQVSASRTMGCGEAIQCVPANDSWSITVDVTS